MKMKQLSLLAVFSVIPFAELNAQDFASGGIWNGPEHDANSPCISELQYAQLKQQCAENIAFLRLNEDHEKTAVPLNWPLQASAELHDCGYYFISAHVDHNAASGAFQDYNCGTIAYDGHKGTDIAVFPFPIHKVDEDLVEVIAAAPGIIIDKHDGEFDKNCVGVGSGLMANYVVLQHSDGSRTLYWHMKNGKVTSKAVGSNVAVGEVLGIVASSGSSSGPHLHFEVWSGSTNSTKVDPFSGSCNLINTQSYWAAQKPYVEPAILKASVHITDVVVPACPNPETLNENDSYQQPFQGPGLAPGYAKFYIFLRNEYNGGTIDMKILNPNGSAFNSWTRNSNNDSKASYWGYSKLLPVTPGIYTFVATYQGVSCSQTFEILGQTWLAESITPQFTLYPNPGSTEVTLELFNTTSKYEVELVNGLGQLVRDCGLMQGSRLSIPRSDLKAGIYFVYLRDKTTGICSTQKMVFED